MFFIFQSCPKNLTGALHARTRPDAAEAWGVETEDATEEAAADTDEEDDADIETSVSVAAAAAVAR